MRRNIIEVRDEKRGPAPGSAGFNFEYNENKYSFIVFVIY